MLDTIDLLETIGKNAALRHISGLELVEVLGRADASEALKAAAMAGDSSLLSAEFGDTPMVVNHDVHAVWKDGEDEDEVEPDPSSFH
jgi:hypothetical protein